jgi:cell division protein FtsL
MENRIEFIDQTEEQKEIRKGPLKELLDGSLLTREAVVRQLPYILFVTFLAVIYIGNRYHAEKVVRETTILQNQIRELRSESISIEAELMDISKQSEVVLLVQQRGLDLKESVEPPKKIIIPE